MLPLPLAQRCTHGRHGEGNVNLSETLAMLCSTPPNPRGPVCTPCLCICFIYLKGNNPPTPCTQKTKLCILRMWWRGAVMGCVFLYAGSKKKRRMRGRRRFDSRRGGRKNKRKLWRKLALKTHRHAKQFTLCWLFFIFLNIIHKCAPSLWLAGASGAEAAWICCNKVSVLTTVQLPSKGKTNRRRAESSFTALQAGRNKAGFSCFANFTTTCFYFIQRVMSPQRAITKKAFPIPLA